MDKTVSTTATAAVLSLALAASPALAAKKVLLKMPVYVSTSLQGLGTTPKWLAEQVRGRQRRRPAIKLYEPGKLIPPKEILQAVHAGQVDAGFTTAGFNTGVLGERIHFLRRPLRPGRPGTPGLALLRGRAQPVAGDVRQGRYRVHASPVGIAPETSGWFPRPVDKPEDLEGLRMRFFGLGALVMEKLGVSTSLLPGNEVFPALEKGAIDATEYSMPAIDERLGLYKILKYNYYPGWHQPATLLEMIVNRHLGRTQR